MLVGLHVHPQRRQSGVGTQHQSFVVVLDLLHFGFSIFIRQFEQTKLRAYSVEPLVQQLILFFEIRLFWSLLLVTVFAFEKVHFRTQMVSIIVR